MRPLTLVDLRYQQNNCRAPDRLGAQVAYIARSAPAWRRPGSRPFPCSIGIWTRSTRRCAPTPSRAWTRAPRSGPVAFHRLILSACPGLDVVAERVLVSVAFDDLGVLLDRRLVWVAASTRTRCTAMSMPSSPAATAAVAL